MVLRGRGRNTGVFMSGHLRFRFAALLLLAGFSTPSASSNPLTDLFSAAPEQAPAPAPAPAQEQCLPQPGKATAGQRWLYHFDGHRKCWFLAAEGAATARKPVHHHAARQPVVTPEENEAAPRERKAVVDARAELIRSAPAAAPPPTPPTPEIAAVDAAPAPTPGAAALVPPAPAVAKPATDQLTPDYSAQRNVDVETLLLAAPADNSDAVSASVPPATPVAVSSAEAGDDPGPGWTTTWLGVLMMALGLVFLLSSSRTLRGTLLVAKTFSAAGGEGRPDLLPSQFDPRHRHRDETAPRDRRRTQATPRWTRQSQLTPPTRRHVVARLLPTVDG